MTAILEPLLSLSAREAVEQRLRQVISIHFDQQSGTRYWLDRAAQLGIDPIHDVQTLEHLDFFGQMTPMDLQSRPLIDFIPQRFHNKLDRFIVGQTGGTTGHGTWTAYRDDEFFDAFVEPFIAAANHVGFPRKEQWLFVGPTGPHIIGKVVRHLAEGMQSADPFSIDFDPRWSRALAEGSFAKRRYLRHLVTQAMAIIGGQDIGVIFATPPVLKVLANTMNESQRLRIRGVHYGGMAMTPAEMSQFQDELFPNAVHISGYGNTLLGCSLELSVGSGRSLDYFPHGTRLLFETINPGDPQSTINRGETQPLCCTRLDESMLFIRMLERDEVTLIPPPLDAPSAFVLPGIRNPHPTTKDQSQTKGLY